MFTTRERESVCVLIIQKRLGGTLTISYYFLTLIMRNILNRKITPQHINKIWSGNTLRKNHSNQIESLPSLSLSLSLLSLLTTTDSCDETNSNNDSNDAQLLLVKEIIV